MTVVNLPYLVSWQAVLTNVEIAEFTRTWAKFDPLGTDYIPAMKGTSAGSQPGAARSPSLPSSRPLLWFLAAYLARNLSLIYSRSTAGGAAATPGHY